MKTSKLFITSLLAAAAMSASAWATSLTDATLSIDAFTSVALTNLDADGWTLTNITGTESGVYTTTDTQGTIGTGTSGASLTTNVPSWGDRYTWSAIFTVSKSAFEALTDGTYNSGVLVSGKDSSANNTGMVGAGLANGNITGAWQGASWNTLNISGATSYADANDMITIGFVYSGGSGSSLFVLDSAGTAVQTASNSSLKSNNELVTAVLSNKSGVSYSNLYWFNSALTTADMTTAMTTVGNGYVWVGTDSGNTWNTEAANTNWIKDGASVAFASGSSVIFGNAAESKTVAINSAVTAGTISVLDDYTFTLGSGGSLAGTFSVSSGKTATLNLTADSSISTGVSSGVVKKTGTNALTYSGTISSGGTLEIAEGSTNSFSGTLSAGGNLIVSSGAVVTHTVTTGKVLSGNIEITGDNSKFIQRGTNGSDQLNYDGTTSIAVKDGGTLELGSNRWTFNANNSLSLDGGNITGSSQSGNYGNLDFNAAKTVNVANSYSKESNISASIRLRNNVTFSVADGATLNITGKIGNATAGKKIIKTGAGRMTLDLRTYESGESAPSESFTGGLDVNGGSVVVKNAGVLGSGAVTVNGTGSILDFAVSGGTFTQGTNQALTTTNGGKITVSAGTLALTGAVDLSSTIEVASGAAVTTTTDVVFSLAGLAGTDNGNGSTTFTLFTLENGASLTWNGLSEANINLAGTTIAGRGVTATFDNAAGTVTVSGTAGDLVWNGGASGTWNYAADNKPWTIGGADTAFLLNDNVTFCTTGDVAVTVDSAGVTAGTVTISSGVVTFSNGVVTADDSVVIGNGATLKLTSVGTGTSVSGTVTVQTGGTLDMNGAEGAGFGGLTMVTLDGGKLVNNGTDTGASKRQFHGIALTADSEVGGSGTFGLVGSGHDPTTLDLGANTLTKTDDNEFILLNTTVSGTGTIRVESGSVTDGGNSARTLTLGDAKLVLAGGSATFGGKIIAGASTLDGGNVDGKNLSVGSVDFGLGSGAQTLTIAGKVAVSGNFQEGTGAENGETISLAEEASLSVGGTFGTTSANANDLSQHSYVVNVGAGASFSAGTIAHGDSLTVNIGGNDASVSATTLVLNSVWGNKTHAFTGQGANVSTLSVGTINLNNASGKTTTFAVSNARLEVGAGGIVGNSSTPVSLSGVTLGVRDGADSWSSALSISLAGTMGADVGADKSISLEGALSGTIESLKKTGMGTLTLSGNNTFSGGVTIERGVLVAGHANALGTTEGTTTVNSGGVLKVAVDGGVTAGMVTLNEGALFAVDLTEYSNVEEDTALTIISSSAISFNSTSAGAMSSNDIEAYFSASNSNLGEWTDYLRTWSYDADSGLRLTLTIPEPSMFGLLAGLGALALAGTRRRRKKA